MPRTSDLDLLNRLIALLSERNESRLLDGPALNRIELLLAEIERTYRQSPKEPPK